MYEYLQMFLNHRTQVFYSVKNISQFAVITTLLQQYSNP